ncbi:MAG TPA: GNAT family N-acetyltransferase [Gaiellales bacterium]|nr:GNAT family N-acetyltransferase [Gaiellales bacterium]
MRIVRATVEDAELCFGIARSAAVAGFKHVFPPDMYPFPDDAIRSDWVSALADPGGETFVAFQDGEAVGVVSVGHGVLQTLYVMPEFWSRGVGGALHDLALVRLREAKVQEARLWTLAENHRGAPSTRNADGVSPAGRAPCRSRPIRSTSNTPARRFPASRAWPPPALRPARKSYTGSIRKRVVAP